MKRRTQEIRTAILQQVENLGVISVMEIAQQFQVTRQAVSKHVRELVASGTLEKTDSKSHPYNLKALRDTWIKVPVGPGSQEDKIWTQSVSPTLGELKNNVREICQYGFTEMFNNVIDHSKASSADIWIKVDPLVAKMVIQDYGVGIWKKLQDEFHLDDPRHALLELTKGKLTTDPTRHTGEGIFFTSRMFDKFIIASDKLTFCRFQEEGGGEYLFDVKEDNSGSGTRVSMIIYLDSERTTKEVFDKFTADLDEFGFTRTHLSVQLAKYEGDHLVSRSQAKRLLSRLEKFKEVFLDFSGVTDIGQGFADEIFRVFTNAHPSIRLIPINALPNVERMIKKAMSQEGQAILPI